MEKLERDNHTFTQKKKIIVCQYFRRKKKIVACSCGFLNCEWNYLRVHYDTHATKNKHYFVINLRNTIWGTITEISLTKLNATQEQCKKFINKWLTLVTGTFDFAAWNIRIAGHNEWSIGLIMIGETKRNTKRAIPECHFTFIIWCVICLNMPYFLYYRFRI